MLTSEMEPTKDECPLTIVAAVRGIGDSRRQRVLGYLERTLNVVTVPVALPRLIHALNLIRTISSDKARWRERSKKNPYYFKAASKALAGAIQKATGGRYDCVLLFEALYAPGLASDACRPYVVYEDSTAALALRLWPDWVTDLGNSDEYKAMETDYYRRATAILTSNERTRQSLITDYAVSGERVINIGQGCDFSWATDSRPVRESGLLVFVGYDFERKGGPDLIDAFRLVKARMPFARLIIVGADIRVDEPGIRVVGRIRSKAELIDLYARASVFVLPAIYDPMPHAALEAMCLEVPVVVSTQCGTSEIIRDGFNGFLVPPRNPGKLADTLIAILGDPEKASAVGHAGAETVRDQLAWDRLANRMSVILRDVIENDKKSLERPSGR